MKLTKIFAILFIALVAMSSCSVNSDNFVEVTLYDEVAGHWYAELPISGETENWRTAEEGDTTTFDKVVALFYLGDSLIKDGWWGYLYLKDDNEMVNYGGIDLSHQANQFNYYMTADRYITPSSHIENTPKVTNMLYDSIKDVITADVTYKGQSYRLTFVRPDDDVWERLYGYYYILLEEGIVGGYDDGNGYLDTDISNDDATEPQRARRFVNE